MASIEEKNPENRQHGADTWAGATAESKLSLDEVCIQSSRYRSDRSLSAVYAKKHHSLRFAMFPVLYLLTIHVVHLTPIGGKIKTIS